MTKRELKKFFKEKGLDKYQIDYAVFLKQMYSTTALDRIAEMARDYQPLSAVVIRVAK